MGVLKSTYVQPNEVIKAADVVSGYDFALDNVTVALQSILDPKHNFIIGGKVKAGSGWNISLEPIFGVNIDNGFTAIVQTETQEGIIGIKPAYSVDRIDTVMVRSVKEQTTEEQRAFIDFDSKSKKLQNVKTRTELKLEIKVLSNDDSGSYIAEAPSVENGWIKIAEIFVPSNATKVDQDCTIYPVTADIPNMDNVNWTNDKQATYNLNSLAEFKNMIRNQHNADGSHRDGVIGKKELNLNGTDGNKITGSSIQTGKSVTVSGTTVAATSNIADTISSIVSKINDIYDSYIKNGTYNFNGTVAISKASDHDITKGITIVTNENGTGTIKIGNKELCTFTNTYIRMTSSYSATNENDIVTKKTTNALDTRLTTAEEKIKDIEGEQGNNAEYTNGVLSVDRFAITLINGKKLKAATTSNIDLISNHDTPVDGVTITNGDYVLVKNQTDAKENGIYQVSSNSSWSRVDEYKSPNSLSGKLWEVDNGTVNKGKIFYTPITIWKNPTETQDIAFTDDEPKFIEYFGRVKLTANRTVVRDQNGVMYGGKAPTNDLTQTVKASTVFNTDEKKEAMVNVALLADLLYPVGFVYTQLPGCKSPSEMGLFGTWEEINFGGAFIRSYGGYNTKPFNNELRCSISGNTASFITDDTHPTTPLVGTLEKGDYLISGDYLGLITDVTISGANIISVTLSDNTLSGTINVIVGNKEGIPNITGNFDIFNMSYQTQKTIEYQSGAFSADVNGKWNDSINQNSTDKEHSNVYFNAAKGETKSDGTLKNDVYGKSDHVTPVNITARYWKRTA